MSSAPAERLPSLQGPRCPRCLGSLSPEGRGLRCTGCRTSYERGPGPETLRVGDPTSRFAQDLDATVSALESVLNDLAAPACTEAIINEVADDAGIEIGNPVWEGRFDVARSLPQASGVVLDVGCGFGTSTIALARSARHVIALDASPARVRLTAARLRAEGLKNATVVHCDRVELPVDDGVCDLVTIVGVLEWMSFGSSDPTAVQKTVLRETERVLAQGGVLLLGIENRYAAHYFCGMPEEHVELPFVSLLPRRLADTYARARGRDGLTTYTHSRRALLGLLSEAGLHPRLGLAVPSYGQPQFVFDEEAFDVAWPFYLRHVFHYSSSTRRAVGALARHSPRAGRTLVPGFFALARKGASPEPVPTVVTGTPDCRGDIKTIDWRRREIRRHRRRDQNAAASEPLLDGWNSRRWLAAPLRRGERRRRELQVLRAASRLVASRPARAVDPSVRDRCLIEARDALQRLSPRLPTVASDWCATELHALASDEAPAVEEHGDFVTANLLVAEDGTITPLDPSRAWALPGRDAAVLIADLFGLRKKAKTLDVDAGFRALAAADARDEPAADAAAGLLGAELGFDSCARRSAQFVLVGVLRHYGARGSLRGIHGFIDQARSGEVRELLKRLRSRSQRAHAR